MIILRHAKFISGSRVYRVGEVLPDTAGTRELVSRGFAEVVKSEKPAKQNRKNEAVQPQPVHTQPAQPPDPVQPQAPQGVQNTQTTQQNAQGNT